MMTLLSPLNSCGWDASSDIHRRCSLIRADDDDLTLPITRLPMRLSALHTSSSPVAGFPARVPSTLEEEAGEVLVATLILIVSWADENLPAVH